MPLALPRVTLAQLVLLELGAAAAAGGIAEQGNWLIAGVAAAAVLLVLAVIPVGGRWMYQLAQSYLALLRRRRAVRGPGLQSLLGGYQVTTVPAGRQGTTFGAVAVGNTWTVPVEVTLDRVLNDDAAVPVDQLATLLRVEDVPMASVRLVTVVSPAPRGSAAAVPSPPHVVARYVLVTLDLSTASAAVAARGGTDAAVAQILRRCALRAEEVLSANGLTVRRLDDTGVAALFAGLFGPSSVAPGGALPPTVETWHDIRVGGTWSMSFAVRGAGPDLADRALALASSAPVPVAVTSLVLRRSGRGPVTAHLLLRVSGPGQDPDRSIATVLAGQARERGLTLQRLDGEQGAVLRETTPVGVAS
jgi:type VII secretion protein EccE